MVDLDPKDLLDQIERRLITLDLLEYKRLQFEIARQKPEEIPWQFENRLHSLQRSARIEGDKQFVEAFKKGIHNNELRKYLMLHQPVITTRTN